MSNITNLSLNEILENIKSKKISSLELTQAYIKNIESAKKLNTFVTTTFEQAIDNAKKFDSKPNFAHSFRIMFIHHLPLTNNSTNDSNTTSK